MPGCSVYPVGDHVLCCAKLGLYATHHVLCARVTSLPRFVLRQVGGGSGKRPGHSASAGSRLFIKVQPLQPSADLAEIAPGKVGSPGRDSQGSFASSRMSVGMVFLSFRPRSHGAWGGKVGFCFVTYFFKHHFQKNNISGNNCSFNTNFNLSHFIRTKPYKGALPETFWTQPTSGPPLTLKGKNVGCLQVDAAKNSCLHV